MTGPWTWPLQWGWSCVGALFTVRAWCINRPCSSSGRKDILLNSLYPIQEESHACRQGRFTAQLFIKVESDLFLGAFFSQEGGSTSLHPTSGLLGPSLQLLVMYMRLLGLGDDKENCLQPSGEKLWCYLDPFLPLDQECHFCYSHHPAGGSSLGHVAASFGHGSAEGEQVHKAKKPHEHLLLLEGLLKLGVPCRLDLAKCLLKSCHSSLMQASCWWWKSMLVTKVHSPQ